ncbi:hypothetical protein [Saccharothrix deserti]|uniref:hypothetical protein n=1 Tax=Saccharothrix deserti TaxID=2593674 RepID=UPI00131C86B6|nr:hypothetical protein [Saccharothrix deserti]
MIVAEYFEAGCTRLKGWADRPRAARSLAALADPDRGFDAIVVGECERGFCGDQFVRMASLFEWHGVQVWLPEAGGRVDLARPAFRPVPVDITDRASVATALGSPEGLRVVWSPTPGTRSTPF